MTLTLDQFARVILFGTRLEDKLVQVDAPLSDEGRPTSPVEVPAFPGRPPHLGQPKKALFPSLHRLHDPAERGKVLHFFANHELLAMELMALMLLRFPDAPVRFREGVARIIQEEQNHLRLYLLRMQELGIEFGDIPVNDYFWNAMKGMRSPLDFTVQMSLTFEQANLDFSLFYMNAVSATGDDATAKILERVFLEEIGHVKHGLVWFNRWRETAPSENEWDAYVKLLPLPLTPQRAKGFGFSESARKKAGFSDRFIRELSVYSGSKGRPPVIWYYNPHCDREIARGSAGFSPTAGAKEISQDLETVPIFLSLETDTVLTQQRPRLEWLEELRNGGFNLPEIAQSVQAPKLGGIQPWGWSPSVFQQFRPLRSKLVDVDGGNSPFCKRLLDFETFEETGLGKLFSKAWSVLFLTEWMGSCDKRAQAFFGGAQSLGTIARDWVSASARLEEILATGSSVMVKAPYGTSGMQVRKIRDKREIQGSLEGPLVGWMKNVLSAQGSIVIEPYLDRLFDLSIQMEITDSKINLLEVRQFIVGSRHEYRGTYLGRQMPGLQPEHLRFFHQVLPVWQAFLRDLGVRLREEGYLGSAGVDAMIWRGQDGEFKFKPLVELNPRWTMGRVALELEKRVSAKTRAVWLFIPVREIKSRGYESAEDFARDLRAKYPLHMTQVQVTHGDGQSARIDSGVIFTTDPACAKSVVTVLATLPNEDLERDYLTRH